MTAYTFDQIIDYTRTSAATYVANTGFVTQTPASRNLLTYTQEFDNAAWIKGGGIPTVTANSIAAPDGTMTADTIAQASSVNSFSVSQIAPTATIGLPYTWSVYLKAGTSRYAQLTFSGSSFGTTQYANIDLQTGTVTASAGSPTVAITSVGNGWYRVAYTAAATAAAAATPFIVLINSATDARVPTITGSSANTIYVWGAQLEAASAASTYTRNVGGVYPPRFDYDPVTLAPRGLLIEEQRTNLLTYSEQFDNAAWTKQGATATANTTTSPDGTVDADALVEDTSTGDHRVFQAYSVTSGVAYVFSVYVKPAGRTLVQLTSAGGVTFTATFDISAGTVTNTATGTASISAAGNGWYRLMITATATSTTSTNMQIRLVNTGTNTSYTGDGTSGIYLWGAQLEAGAFATSYIPTVASQVTRTADLATVTGANFSRWYNQSEGTLVAEFDTTSTLLASSALSVDDATNNNFIRVGRINTTGRLRVFNGGVDQADVLPANAPGWAGVVKIAAAYKANDFAASASGGAASTDTSGTIPAVTQLRLGASGGGDPINGHLRRIRYYPTRLSNTQLQALTA